MLAKAWGTAKAVPYVPDEGPYVGRPSLIVIFR
jgi:hypothetical protein